MARSNRGWQEFVNALAERAREDERQDRRLKQEAAIGRVLYAVIFSALIAMAVGLTLQHLGWMK